MALGYPFDEPVETEASQIVSHLSWSDLAGVDAQQLGQRLAKISVGEAFDLEDEQDKDTEESLNTLVIET